MDRLDKLVSKSAGVTHGPPHQYLSIQRTRFAYDVQKMGNQIKLMEDAVKNNPVCAQIKSERLSGLRALHKVAQKALEEIEAKLGKPAKLG